MFDSLFGPIERLINERGSAVILKERISLLHDKMQLLAEDNERLKEELRKVKAERDEMRKAVDKEAVPAEYTKHRGVLFRRSSETEIEHEVYCPRCIVPMGAMLLIHPFRCSLCRLQTSFKKSDLSRVISEIR